jgi:predicted Zn-dependent peptidase
VAPQNLAKAMKSSLDELAKYVREGATEEEVNTQKNYFAGYFQVGLGTNDGVAGALVASEKYGFGPGYLDDYPKRFRAVTREQVNAALAQHFLTDRLHVIVAGDLDQLPDEAK